MVIALKAVNDTGFTYDDLKTDALIALKGTKKAAYDDPIMNKIVNDAVQIAHKLAARRNPEMVQSLLSLHLSQGNSGPYAISKDYETPVKLLNEDEKEVDSSYRGEFNVAMRIAKPDGYWVEGFFPADLYFNATPDKDYDWTFYYIASKMRVKVADFSMAVPLPGVFREPLVEFITKFGAQTQEYTTVEEDQKIALLDGLLADILRRRRSAYKLKVSGVGF